MNQDAATGSNEEVELTSFPLFPVLLSPQFLPLTLLLVLLVLLLVLLLCVFFLIYWVTMRVIQFVLFGIL